MRRELFAPFFALLLAGCASSPAPVTERGVSDPPPSGYHRVREGDTLYSIAWRYGIDWEALALRNRIGPPYTIRPGQRIRVLGSGPPHSAASNPERAPASANASTGSASRTTASRTRTGTPTRTPTGTPTRKAPLPSGPIAWDWPLEGEVVQGFALTGQRVNKGLDIRGAPGAMVRAAARGEVVYAGTGLRGHSRLVIVKHDETWLSAYAHDDEILVKEGQHLVAGDQVARLAGDAPRVLHFEIRRQGKPVDPSGLLPKR